MADESPTEPTAAEKLASEYDHSASSGFDPDEFPQLTSPPDPPPTRPVPTKDPITGKFVKAQAEPAAEPPVASHSPRMVRMAQQMGVPEDQIASMSPDALENVVEILHQQMVQGQRSSRSWDEPRREPPPEAEPDPLPELKDDEWDARLTGPIKKMFQGMQKEISGLKRQLQSESSARANQTLTQIVDQAIESLGDGERYGTGALHELDQIQALERHALFAMATQMVGTNDPRKIAAKIKELHAIRSGKKPTTPKPAQNGAQPRFTQEQWDQAGLSRPTSRGNNPEAKTRESAIRAVARKQKDMLSETGGDSVLSDGNEEDTIPD